LSENTSEQEKRLARLLANTLRRKRAHPITSIAKDIIWLENNLGSLRELSKRIGVSTEMLKRFLNVKKLHPDVQKLIKQRKIDSVEIVNHLAYFNSESQLILANYVIDGYFTSDDLKVLRSYKKNYPNLKIKQLINRILPSIDKKIYVLYFYIPSNLKPKNILQKFHSFIEKNEIVSFEQDKQIAKIKLTKRGLNVLRDHAKKENLNLRDFIKKNIVYQ